MKVRVILAAAAMILLGLVLSQVSTAQEVRDEAPGETDSATPAPKEDAQPDADKPAVVRVGALINDIQQLDLQSHSYNVDMYLWFKWKDPKIDPSRSFEFLNSFELWGHILTYETAEPERLADGSYYQVLRNQGKFNTKLPLERYPFDSQNLRIELEDSTEDSTGLIYKPDTDPVALSRDLVLPGWEIQDPELRIIDNEYDSNFGDPDFEDITYSRAIFDVPVQRPKGTYALKLLLPMLLVALTAALSLLLHPRYVEGRIGIGITALLTLVALQLTSNSSLPEVDYLILLDKLYILSYAFVVLTMVLIVRNSWVDAEGDVVVAKRLDRRSLAVLTVAYVVAAAVLLITGLA